MPTAPNTCLVLKKNSHEVVMVDCWVDGGLNFSDLKVGSIKNTVLFSRSMYGDESPYY